MHSIHLILWVRISCKTVYRRKQLQCCSQGAVAADAALMRVTRGTKAQTQRSVPCVVLTVFTVAFFCSGYIRRLDLFQVFPVF
jgi:hypothetical protein